MRLNIPTVLTVARIAAIPLLVAVYYLPLSLAAQNVAATAIFIVAALTDWLDGYLARRLGESTAFGAFLDPVADKLLVAAALVMLVQLGRADALIALVIVGREITISALREWMAQLGQPSSVAVHKLGKFKTAAQLVAIPMLLFDDRLLGIDCALVGTWLIWAATLLTIWSMLYYLRCAWPTIKSS